MITPHRLKVLRKLYTQLEKSSVSWAVIGSLGLALQRLPVDVHDIDIRSDKTGVYEIETLFSQFSTKKVTFCVSRKVRSYFGTLEIDGITVEIMGNLQFRHKNGTWGELEDFTDHLTTVPIDDMEIPVLSLEYEYTAYLRLGRTARAVMIKKWLETHRYR